MTKAHIVRPMEEFSVLYAVFEGDLNVLQSFSLAMDAKCKHSHNDNGLVFSLLKVVEASKPLVVGAFT